ncbi:isoprenylcysteine carboxylmethyltransferase family protein [uncultured Roseobacter sp.]|uniref:methyltransferase family protein n=1 Tax=uncultured Roseobacter sp. TaxID=114847 RepID=UPI002615A90E|nr:isoprenylcysteine carboxylmethyltransferase family protein [uncultured Roseobacter sp.]
MKWLDVPPVWLVGFAVLAWLQSQYFSFGLSLAHPVTLLLAGLFVGAGIVLTLLAVMEFRRHKTTIIPHETPDSLIQSGVFGRSRNPIYLADVLILAGLCLWWDAVLALALVPILVWVLERRFIVPEENRMRRVFRADFARYEQKVRRWL